MLYVLLVLLGHIGFLLLLLFVPLILTASVLPARIAALLAITGAGALQLFLLVDTFIYDLYRFHFSGFVLDMLINAGSDVFRFSLTTWLQAGAAVLGMLLPRETDPVRQLPADVSFAVAADLIAARLAQGGIAAATATPQGALAPEDLTRLADGMTVLVSCWN